MVIRWLSIYFLDTSASSGCKITICNGKKSLFIYFCPKTPFSLRNGDLPHSPPPKKHCLTANFDNIANHETETVVNIRSQTGYNFAQHKI